MDRITNTSGRGATGSGDRLVDEREAAAVLGIRQAEHVAERAQ